MNVEVILTENDPKLGERGQIVRVAPGFANNFLFPNRKALLATAANKKRFEAEKVRQSHQKAERLEKAQELAKKIEGLSVTVEVATGEGDKLYGAVTNQEIHQQLQSRAIAVEKRNIHLAEPIKKLGTYEVAVKLHPEVSAKLKVWVAKKK